MLQIVVSTVSRQCMVSIPAAITPANTRRCANSGLMLASVVDSGSALAHHRVNVTCLLGLEVRV